MHVYTCTCTYAASIARSTEPRSMRCFIFGSPHTPPEDIDERDNEIRIIEQHLQKHYDENHVGEADDESESEPDEEEYTPVESQGVHSVPTETSQTVTAADSLETQTEATNEPSTAHGDEPERAPAPARASLAAPAPARRQTGLQQFFQVKPEQQTG